MCRNKKIYNFDSYLHFDVTVKSSRKSGIRLSLISSGVILTSRVTLVYWKRASRRPSFQLTTIKIAPYTPTDVESVYTSRHATQVNSNGGSAIPISDWLSSKFEFVLEIRGRCRKSGKSGFQVIFEIPIGVSQCVKSGRSWLNRESWHVCFTEL